MTVKYVVREGHEKGKGRYVGPGEGADWKMSKDEAYLFTTVMAAAEYASAHGGRVVPVTVRKVPRKVRVTKEQLEVACKTHFEEGGGMWVDAVLRPTWRCRMRAAITALGFEVEA